MPAVSKIQDEGEVLRWFEEGRTYRWMVEQYMEKYGIETSLSMWANYRRRHGLDRRITWDDKLIPWIIKPEHRYLYPILMLRKEARRRAGMPLSAVDEAKLDRWLQTLKDEDAVVHYDPETAEGWFYVPRRPEVDLDLIREPKGIRRRRKGEGDE